MGTAEADAASTALAKPNEELEVTVKDVAADEEAEEGAGYRARAPIWTEAAGTAGPPEVELAGVR